MVLLESLSGCTYYLATVSLFQVGQGRVSKGVDLISVNHI